MSVRNPMRLLHMGCGESLQRALPPSKVPPLLENEAKPLLSKTPAKPQSRKPR